MGAWPDWNRDMAAAPRDGRKVLLTNDREVMLCAWDVAGVRHTDIGEWVAAYHPDSGWASDLMEAPTGWMEPPAP